MQTSAKIQAFYHLLKRSQEIFSLRSLLQPIHFDQHVKDIQFVASRVKEPSVVELGAGVGQGIFLLAIFRPDVQWGAIEKNVKKRGWMQIHKTKLEVSNLVISPSLEEYFQVFNQPISIFLKAFSPLKALPRILERFHSNITKLYIVEGKTHGLSSVVSSPPFFQVQVEKMSHGHHRFFVIFEKS